jgi:membrane-associated protein
MLDVESIITGGGLLLIALIIFAESGMFVGFFFPGDTLLLSVGVFAAAGQFPLALSIAIIAAAAIAGDNTGYWIGRKYGRRLFRKPDGIIFRQSYVQHAERFYERWGSKTMLFAHFVPIVRTFAPPVAGVAHMPYKKFFTYGAIGILAWSISITSLGYFVGSRIPHLDKYIHYALLAVIIITLGPTLYHIYKAFKEKRRLKNDIDKISDITD